MVYLSIVTSLMLVMTGPFGWQEESSPQAHLNQSTVHAKAAVKVIGWVHPYYLWRNNTTIIAFLGDLDGDILNGLEEFHFDTGRHNTLDAFNRRWKAGSNTKGGIEKFFVRSAAISPNGKWMVWEVHPSGLGDIGLGNQPGIMTVSLDGKHWLKHDYRPTIVDSIAWAPDSRCWIGLGSDQVAGIVYDVNTHIDHSFDFSSRMSLPKIGYASWQILTCISNSRLLLMLLNRGYYPHGNDVHFAEISKKKDKTALRLWAVTMPANAYASEVGLSPKGDRVIWNLNFVPPGYDPDKGLPEPEKSYHSEIWISGFDGSGMKRLDDLVFDDPARNENGEWNAVGAPLFGMKWSPDGKRISFIHRDVLYIAEVP